MDFTSLSAHTGKDLTAVRQSVCWRVTFQNFSNIEMNGYVDCLFFLIKVNIKAIWDKIAKNFLPFFTYLMHNNRLHFYLVY